MQLSSKKGFTLIELLIVVAIIGILASVILVGLGPTQRAGRDARRIADLREVQTGLELYYQKYGYYPNGGSNGGPFAWNLLTTNLTVTSIGVDAVPNDPAGGTATYYYGTGTTGGVANNLYTLKAVLEDNQNRALKTSIHSNNSNGLDCSGAASYCVSNGGAATSP